MSLTKKPVRGVDGNRRAAPRGDAAAERAAEGRAALGANSKAAQPGAGNRGEAEQLSGFDRLVQKMPEGEIRDYVVWAMAEYEKYTERLFDASIDAGIDARMKRRDEEATERQIMVDNFRIFRRDYINMAIRRSC